jgi:hypothetical protein
MLGVPAGQNFGGASEKRAIFALKGELGKGHQESNLNLYETSYQSISKGRSLH